MVRVSLSDRVPLPADPAGAVDYLRHALFDRGVPVYVLFDPILGAPLGRPWSDEGAPAAEHVISLAQCGLPLESSPYFVRIERPLSCLLDETLAVAKKENSSGYGARSVCGWFTSPHEPVELRSQMQRLIQQRDANGRRWIFRFYDPRVMQHLGFILGRPFMAPGISHWFFLDAASRLVSQHRMSATEPLNVVGDDKLPLLDRVSLVNQAHSHWRSIDSSIPADAFGRLFEAAEQAICSGLDIDQTADCVSFMLHRCVLHPHVERHPLVAEWLEDAKQGRRSYADAAAEAPSTVWEEITSGRWIDAWQGAHHG